MKESKTGLGREAPMRSIFLALVATGMVVAGLTPAHAVGTRYPFCLQGTDSPGLSNCTFTSYQQCQATASGRLLYCVANPFYGGGGEPRVYRERRPPPGYPYSRY
jgi:Protein of unknown function (DUF3551)